MLLLLRNLHLKHIMQIVSLKLKVVSRYLKGKLYKKYIYLCDTDLKIVLSKC